MEHTATLRSDVEREVLFQPTVHLGGGGRCRREGVSRLAGAGHGGEEEMPLAGGLSEQEAGT